MSAEPLGEMISWKAYDIPAGLATGSIPVHVGEVGSGGPVGVVIASVHGDEGPWGTLSVNRLIARASRDELIGTLRVVPVAHPLAMAADARQTDLDLLDLNNVFPGDRRGTHTQRLAAVLAEHVIDGANVVLDVHGGGSWNINCFTYRFPGSHELAAWMRTPLIFDGPDRSTSLTGYARAQGATGAWIEMGGRGEWEEDRAEHVTMGLRHALGKAGVMTPVSEFGSTPVVGSDKVALSTSSAGIYRPRIRERGLGTIVERGTVIGELLDPVSSRVLEEFVAPYDRNGLALLRPTLARIEAPGKVVAVVADVTGAG